LECNQSSRRGGYAPDKFSGTDEEVQFTGQGRVRELLIDIDIIDCLNEYRCHLREIRDGVD